MRNSCWVQLCLVCVLVLLAGCGSNVAKTKIGPTVSASPPLVTEDTGSISGVVTDEALIPLPKVGVVIAANADFTTETDVAGKFTLNDIPPGEHSIVVARAGYETATREIDVLAGETVETSITLKPVIIVKPHVEHFVDEGRIPFSMALPSVLASNTSATGDSVTHFEHEATQGVVAAVSTGTWDRSTPLTATRMTVRIEIESDSAATGMTPVTARLFGVTLPSTSKILLDFTMAHVCNDAKSCVEDPPYRLGQVVYDQRTTLYTDVYYVDEPTPEAVAGAGL